MAKVLMKGNEAIAEAAIQAGCRFFFGYPITPQNEIPEYMSRRMPQENGCYLQAESEVAAINMVYGAAAAGARTMTSSSSPGISLKQEGISYIAGAELPCVIVNIMRGGSGLGGIQPAQSDYWQATRGGGHGDYRTVVLAPATLQEAVDLVQEAFDIADEYRVPVMVLGDGMLGQMMEAVEFGRYTPRPPVEKPWATNGRANHTPGAANSNNIANSLYLDPAELERVNLRMFRTYDEITKKETKVACDDAEDADIVVVAYGTTARIVRSAINLAAKQGVKAALVRPITLWPFPSAAVAAAAAQPNVKAVLTVEMSGGQMVDDVRIAVNGQKPVHFLGRTGGMVPMPQDILQRILELAGGAN